MRRGEKGFTLLESLFAMLIVSAGVAAALEIHSATLKNRALGNAALVAETEIESLMERDRGRLGTLVKSGATNPIEEIFSHIQTSELSCKNLSRLDCEKIAENSGTVCRAPESTEGAVKIKYIACVGKNSFRGEQFIRVSRK
ncbi:MAG: prepilin-type N-terminal cleavage/methylation domain-containing protein [Candidatus Mycalebacterium zealandia]|nr:MAG: prepilin-type N-terminal cleavage/methylation domain-containing protein [Candidatus Mycalebacterium zealandia]